MPSKKSVHVRRSTRAKNVARPRRSTRSAKSARATKTTRITPEFGAWALVICVMSAALVIAGRPSVEQSALASADLPHEASAAQVLPAAASAAAVAKIPAAATPAKAAASETTTPPVETSDAPIAAEPAPIPSVEETAPVTMAGCLEADEATFRLRDATGTNAPKSRSWKTGFLRRRAASIQVIDTANRGDLSNHVGEWVAVTGTLVDRAMHVQSLERVAGSCNRKPEASLTANISSH